MQKCATKLIFEQIKSLQEALKHVKQENTRLLSSGMKSKLDHLPPIVVPRWNFGFVAEKSELTDKLSKEEVTSREELHNIRKELTAQKKVRPTDM